MTVRSPVYLAIREYATHLESAVNCHLQFVCTRLSSVTAICNLSSVISDKEVLS